MSSTGSALYSKNLFLLTLKGQIVIEFMDGHTLEGEFATQDELNLFITAEDEPIMIPRSQIRYIKGKEGQSITEDDSQANFQAVPSTPVQEEVDFLPPDVDDLDDTDRTMVLAQEDEGVDEIGELDEATLIEEAVAAPGFAYPEAEFVSQDVDLAPDDDDDEDPTLVLEEKPEAGDLEDATFVLPEATAGIDTQETAAHLDCITGPHAGEAFKLVPGMTTIGRSSDNILSLFKDKEISRKHSKIVFESGSFIVEDQNSLNGTFVNDERIESPRYLEDGDVILIGVSTLVYHK
jgi:hypothetical protein